MQGLWDDSLLAPLREEGKVEGSKKEIEGEYSLSPWWLSSSLFQALPEANSFSAIKLNEIPSVLIIHTSFLLKLP